MRHTEEKKGTVGVKPPRQPLAAALVPGARLRRLTIQALRGVSHGKLYSDIAQGVWTKPVRRSSKDVYWPATEYQALTAAETAGYTKEQMRKLVDQLHAKRQQATAEG